MKVAIAPTIEPINVPVEIWLLLDDDDEAVPPTGGLAVGLMTGPDVPDVTTVLEPGTRAEAVNVGAAPLKSKLVSVLVPVAVVPPDMPAIVGRGGGAPFCRLCCCMYLGMCMATGQVVVYEGNKERLGLAQRSEPQL